MRAWDYVAFSGGYRSVRPLGHAGLALLVALLAVAPPTPTGPGGTAPT
ncbi:MAG: hypothetical protein NTZ05_18010 [Chloroflexi bacterium]|nr:hypothetical protein [Chloroflexota bacterium]